MGTSRRSPYFADVSLNQWMGLTPPALVQLHLNLDQQTMAALRKRGFRPGDVGNAPATANVRRVAVWSTEENDVEARLVARQFGKRVEVTLAEEDLGPGVDVIVGNKFKGLKKAKRSVRVQSPQEVCIPAPSPGADTNAAG